MTLVGFDLDGVLIARADQQHSMGAIDLKGSVVISGRTFAEYDDTCRELAQQVPLYIRGVGQYGDHAHAAWFKSMMITMLGVTRYFEDRADQAEIIRRECPNCEVILVE